MASMLPPLNRKLSLLDEFVAPEFTTLRAKHNGKGGFTFNNTSTKASPELLFTVDSRQSILAPRRTIRNAAGVAILDLWRKLQGGESYVARPNSSSPPLAIIAPRITTVKENIDVYVKNGGATDGETKLEIRGQDIWKRNTDVYLGNGLAMQIRFVNFVTSYVPFSSTQWDVTVSEGLYLSLAFAIVVYLSTTLYTSSYFRSSYGLELKDDSDDPKRQSRKSMWTRVGTGIGAGAAGGAA
ncbi:hypothetical protein WHR41_00725 [Cladosporium halotolerans]|uniref:Signal sequence receptor subunit alpha n=1 Tax=Cladosporium halotolerans TaxID=1052096 RepID=A0AB34KZJ8_9PEZI